MTENEQRDTGTHPPNEVPTRVTVGATDTQTPQSKDVRRKCHYQRSSAAEWAGVVVEAIGLIVLTFYACFTYGQWQATKLSADAAKDAARAATDSNALARDKARMELRAYVAVDDVTYNGLDAEHKPSFSFTPENGGVTPALEFRMERDVRLAIAQPATIWPAPIEVFPCAWREPSGDESLVILSAKVQSRQTAMGDPLDSEGIDAVEHAAGTLYVRGCLRYRDIFQGTHTTRFCAYWNPGDKTVKWCGGEHNRMD